MKVAVTGAGGMLASEMINVFSDHGVEVFAFKKHELDITDYHRSVNKLKRTRPDVIINCAAYTDVDKAQENRKAALKVNALGPRNLSFVARELAAVLVHISTDYVFDGNKKEPYHIFDRPNPVNYQGYTKYIGEQFVISLCPSYYLIRTSWLFGAGGKNFVDTILEAARTRDCLMVVDDQVGSPTYTKDVASATIKLINTPFFGVYNVTNQGYASRHDFAKKIIEYAGGKIKIKPIKSKHLNRPAVRPFNSRLDPFPLQETIGELLPPWEDALTRYLESKSDWS